VTTAPARPAFTLRNLAAIVGAALEGDGDRMVHGVAPLDAAGPRDISFVLDSRHTDAARASRAGAFLAGDGISGLPAPVLRTPSPQLGLIRLLEAFHPATRPAPGVHPAAIVDAAASVDPSATVGACTVIERGAVVGRGAQLFPLVYVGVEAEVGEDTVLFPHVVLRERVKVGRRVVIHSGAVLGADGFGYVQDGGEHRKIPQVGGVLVEDDVEIGANTTIDRATVGDTVIRRGSKIDNLVQIAHNVEIGERSIVVAQVGISGSSRLGRGVILAGQVGVTDHVTLADGVIVGARGGVATDLPTAGIYLGAPARPATEMRRIAAAEAHLPQLFRRVRALERRLDAADGRPSAPGEAQQT
jgi:UDP-3-O-[3-hydroxymyristoyl] glucosamine N-acyltransferase